MHPPQEQQADDADAGQSGRQCQDADVRQHLPGAVHLEETLTSLMYAARVKQITNSAARNADNKEITRLKNVSGSC